MVIAFFDSGIGGLTVLQLAMRELPNHAYLYYADTKHAPYGVQPEELVRKHVFAAVDFIAQHDIQALVVACNTATSAGGFSVAGAGTGRAILMDLSCS